MIYDDILNTAFYLGVLLHLVGYEVDGLSQLGGWHKDQGLELPEYIEHIY
jgi:hypothetical protein